MQYLVPRQGSVPVTLSSFRWDGARPCKRVRFEVVAITFSRLRPTDRQIHASAAPPVTRKATSERVESSTSYAASGPGIGSVEPWQRRAMHYERIVGEVGAAANFMEFAGDRLVFKPGLLDAQNSAIVADDPNTDAQWLARQFSTMPKGRAMRELFVAAECYVIVEQKQGEAGFCFTVASISELEPMQGGVLYRSHPVDPGRQLYTAMTPKSERPAVLRIWREDAEYRARPFGWIGRVLDNLEALVLLTLADKAVSLSRIAGAGIVYLPNEAVLPQLASNELTGELEPSVLDRLTEAMIIPIQDRSHPDSLVPIVLTGPAEYAQAIKHLTFQKTVDPDDFTKRRQEHLRAVANAADLPASRVLNTEADSKFWNAFQVDKDTARNYVIPYAELVSKALTPLYQHCLRQLGHSHSDRAILAIDETNIVSRPDNGQAAILLRQMGILRAEPTLEANGFTRHDMMEPGTPEFNEWVKTEETRRRRYVRENPRDRDEDGKADDTGVPLEQAEQDANPESLGYVPKGLPGGGEPPTNINRNSPDGDTNGDTTGNRDDRVNKADRNSVDRFTGRNRKAALSDPLEAAHAKLEATFKRLVERIHAKGETVFVNALRAAGGRVASIAGKANHRDPDIAILGTEIAARLATIEAKDRHKTCAVVGRDLIVRAGLTEDILLRDAFEAYGEEVSQEIDDAHEELIAVLGSLGYEADRTELATRRDRAVEALLIFMAALATKRLYGDDLIDPRGEEPMSGELPIFTGLLPARISAGASVSASGRPDWAPILTGPSGYLDDPYVRAALAESGIGTVTYEWIHGYWGTPKRAFAPHLELDGTTFTTWDDERLSPDPRGEWLALTGGYYPSDHAFCTCWTSVQWG